jgi:hypothetical protein
MAKRVVRAATVRFTAEDLEVLAKLEKFTGLRRSQIIRASLRSVLRKIEAEMYRKVS